MEIKDQVVQWLEQFIIGHNICPFAKGPWERQEILLQESNAQSGEQILNDFSECLSLLDSSTQYSTALFYLPNVEISFLDFNDFTEHMEDILKQKRLDKTYQLVVFHPGFYFADTDENDLANYVNRSPYPMIHIINRQSISDAINSFEEAEKISYINENKIKAMPKKQLNEIFWFLKK